MGHVAKIGENWVPRDLWMEDPEERDWEAGPVLGGLMTFQTTWEGWVSYPGGEEHKTERGVEMCYYRGQGSSWAAALCMLCTCKGPQLLNIHLIIEKLTKAK